MGHGEQDNEPLDEGAPDEHTPRGAPPDPLDRLWRHPTELPPLAAGSTTPATARGSGGGRVRTWTLPIIGGAAGAIVTVAALAVAGVLDRGTSTTDQPDGRNSVRVTSTAPPPVLTAGLSIVAIAARDAKGTRRGSGVCVRHAGRVLTSARVVGDATTVDVLTSDGQQHRGRVLGRDPTTDLVLVDIGTSASVPAARLADASPATGSSVWVLGAARPGSADLWQSSGLLASKNAIVAAQGGPTMSGLLETDANSGNAGAGGALIDPDGDVVGIVMSRIGGSSTTYAVPIEQAVAIGEELSDHGYAAHGSAGVRLADTPYGPSIVAMSAHGPAARAGARLGDVVLSIDGALVESPNDVAAIVHGVKPGGTVTFVVRRGKDEVEMHVELGATTT